jgi:hypothetical protein
MFQPTTHRFEIRVSGLLGADWSDEFEGVSLSHIEGDTLFEGEVQDQSALFGVLHMIENLGLTVVSVTTFPNGI